MPYNQCIDKWFIFKLITSQGYTKSQTYYKLNKKNLNCFNRNKNDDTKLWFNLG